MNTQKLCIATISWARDESEEELLRQSLTELSSLGYKVFVADGGSGKDFINFIRSLNHLSVLQPTQKGLWAQAKTSLLHALQSGASYVLYTEPDKLDFFKQLPTMLNDVEVNEHTGIVLASRSNESMQSFPTFQQMTEAAINNCCAEVIGKTADYTYGPFIMNSNIITHLRELPDDIGWGWRPYAFNIAHRLHLNIQAYTQHFYCPTNQRHDDSSERLYRVKQLAQNIEGLVLSTSASLG